MSRKQTNFAREILPDPKFQSEMITRFINMVMVSGKRSVAEKIVYGAIDTIGEKNKSADAVELVEKALDNVSPMVEVKSRRVAGELMDAVANRGTAVKKREETHRMAEANKAFAHYRW